MNYAKQSFNQFLNEVASESAHPAGGTVAAIVGAAGASLCEMVCIHTINYNENLERTTEFDEIRDDLKHQRHRLFELADADAEAVEKLLTVFQEDTNGTEAKQATGVPLAIAEACLTVLEHAIVVTEQGNPNAVPDGITGTYLTYAALQASIFTVRNNLEYVNDTTFTDEMNQRTVDIEHSAERAYEQILENK